MNTTDVATHLGTSPRTLRTFLRSDYSTFAAVGSGSRYEFTESELPTLAKRFNDWAGAGKPRPETSTTRVTPLGKDHTARAKQHKADAAVWEEEGDVVLEDIRNPRVRARVRAEAEAAERLLATRLIAAKLHVAQAFITSSRKAS